jgi:hypothetical protein
MLLYSEYITRPAAMFSNIVYLTFIQSKRDKKSIELKYLEHLECLNDKVKELVIYR